jgi:hypothetical protein
MVQGEYENMNNKNNKKKSQNCLHYAGGRGPLVCRNNFMNTPDVRTIDTSENKI